MASRRRTSSEPTVSRTARPPRVVLDSAEVSAPTKATAVVDALRSMIVDGRLAPGEKLKLEHLAVDFGVGRSPLREACNRLAAEGFVTIADQRGFRVAGISRAELIDLMRTRQQVEGLALRGAVAHGDVVWEGEVTGALHRLQRARAPIKAGPLDAGWEREHARLHQVLLSACPSPLLLRFCQSLSDQAERYRRLAAAYGQPARHLDQEHQALVQAALARDAERAVALLVEHIARTTDNILAHSAAFEP